MTALGSGAPGRENRTDAASRRGFDRRLALIMAIGLVFRLMMAYASPISGSGFDTDLNLFRYWAQVLAEHGPWGFYANASYADYTPGYLYALWPVGVVGSLLGGVGDLIKLPAIITDVVMGYVVYLMARDLGVTDRRATIAAAVVILNPISWFDSVVWGQVDSFGTVFLLLSVRELWRGRPERAAILAVVAMLTKPQLAILVPIVAAVTIRRALRPEGGWGNEAAPEPSGFGWERRTAGPIRILTTGAAGFLTAVVMATPFALTVVWPSTVFPFLDSSLLRLVFNTAAVYPYLTVNAYNAWALFPVEGRSMASGAGWLNDSPAPDAVAWGAIGPLPAALVGGLLLGLLLFVVVPWIVARRPDRLTILTGAAVLALAFFAVPTRVHERYLFPLFGLGAILLAFSTRWRVLYLVAGTATFLNMYVVLTTLYPGCTAEITQNCNPHVADWLGIGPAIRSYSGVAMVAAFHTGAFLWALVQLRAGAADRLAGELAEERPGADGPGAGTDAGARSTWAPQAHRVDADATWLLPEEPASRAGAPAPGIGSDSPATAAAGTTPGGAIPVVPVLRAPAPDRARPAGPTAARQVPAWYDRPSLGRLGPIGWLRNRLRETPIRPDRSRGLAGERGGRLDRLDVWILVVLVVASLGLRMFRLAEPARMHFDEVYHARTATEFLQDWRYGISHNIYEWTHPHFAKYAMAVGIMTFAGHDVSASGDLGVPVLGAAVEPRREDPLDPGRRAGDRAWIVTGSELVAYDLETRKPVARWAVGGASAVAYDETGMVVYVGTDAGQLLAVDVSALDEGGFAPDAPPAEAVPVGTAEGAILQLTLFAGGQHAGLLLPGDRVSVMDTSSGETTGTMEIAGAVDMAAAGDGDAVVVTPADVVEPAAVAAEIVRIAGGDAAAIEADLVDAERDTVVLPIELTAQVRTDVNASIEAGTLAGVQIAATPLLAVAGSEGLALVTSRASLASAVALPGGASGLALVSGVDDGTQLWATSQDPETGKPQVTVVSATGDAAKDGPKVNTSFELPAAATRIVYDATSEMVEVLGLTPDGTGTTVYVIEPHGRAVFADHRLPFAPSAWALDHNENYPAQSRGALLAFAPDGTAASLDVGSYHFSWRLPGVIFGALTAGLLFLLGRILFRRRVVGVLVGLFVLFDGMFFVQSRIAMNDVYTGTFILAAYALFAWLWLERRSWRSFVLLMPLIGLLLGLGLASKWVAAYAIGALGILVLVRSALGRLILILAMIALTGVLGWMALAVPVDSTASGNLLFTLIMIGLTLATVVVTIYHPIAWSDDELRLAVGGPPVLGFLLVLTAIATGKADASIALGPLLLTPLTLGFALVVAGAALYAAFTVVGRYGFGPLARTPDPDDPDAVALAPAPAAEGWLRLGAGLGLPAAYMAGCLLVIPLVVYVISFLPWAMVEGHQVVDGWPAGHTGQTLLGLTGEMYRYHNNLTAAHAASSPWWAWPLNLKPVWFYQGGFAGSTGGAIYDAGNVVIWWLGIPAMVFAAFQGFKRRSPALALIVIGFLAQWISWARIDRAAFEYHYYTSLPFVVLALGYFAGEIWHGASRRTWLLARVAAAVALMGPVILWLLRLPLCTLANVEAVNKGSQACNGNPGNLVVTPSVAVMVVVGLGTAIVLVRQLWMLGRPRADGHELAGRDLLPLVGTAAAGGAAIAVSRLLPSVDPLISIPGIVPELIALLVAIPLGLVAVQVVTARDARRFVAGLVAAAGAWFVILYPNISGLPLPSVITPAYQGLLPTYLYAFQFNVNTVDRSGAIAFADPRFALLLVALAVACCVVAYSAWVWRQALLPETVAIPAEASTEPDAV